MRKHRFQICAASAMRLFFQHIFTPNPSFLTTVHTKRLLPHALFSDFSWNILHFRCHFHCIFSCTLPFVQYPSCEMLVLECTSRRRPNVSPLLLHSKSSFLQHFPCEMLTFLFIVRPLLCHQLLNGLVGFAKRKEFILKLNQI